jgi:hypothetical protein
VENEVQTLQIDVQTSVLESSISLAITIELTLNAVGELQALAMAEQFGGATGDRSGLLFGTFENGSLRVDAVRQLPPKGQTSGLARLSQKQFDELLRIARQDPALENSGAVGWYRFHNTAELAPDEIEIEFHQKFFTRADHIGLILKGRDAETMQALLCTRGKDGSISRAQQNGVSLFLRGDDAVNVVMNVHPTTALTDQHYLKPYQVLAEAEAEESKSRSRRFALAVAAILMVAVAIIVAFWPSNNQQEPPARESNLVLNVAGNGPNLLINWSGGIPQAKSAGLRIFDGNTVRDLNLLSRYQPSGSITVPRQSGNVQVILSISDGTQVLQSQSSLIDPGFKESVGPLVKGADFSNAGAALVKQKPRTTQSEDQVKQRRKRTENDSRRARR